jgi:hypothetical protein
MYKGLWHLDKGLSFCVMGGKAPETIRMLSKPMDIVVALIAKKEGGRGKREEILPRTRRL